MRVFQIIYVCSLKTMVRNVSPDIPQVGNFHALNTHSAGVMRFIFELRRLIRACRAHPFCEAAGNFSGALAPNVWLRVEAKLRKTAASERRGGVCQAADVPQLYLQTLNSCSRFNWRKTSGSLKA